MSDNEFDLLIDTITLKDPKNKLLTKIGTQVMTKNKVKLPHYMGSMNKIKPDNSEALEKFKNKFKEPYYISDKLDGISGLLEINNKKKTIKLYTRGDGEMGNDISPLIEHLNIPQVKNIDYIVIRGELLMSKTKFKKYQDNMANARNMVAGIVNSRSINKNIKDVDFVTYEIIEPQMSIKEQYELLTNNNFKVVINSVYKNKDINVDNLSNILKNRKLKSDYEIDGIIITSNYSIRSSDGNPDYAFAFKETPEDQIALVKVIDVEWNESKDGYLKPRLLLEPTKLTGVTITHVTAFNGKYVFDNKIGPGTIIKLIRSGDVIPHIVEIIKSSKEPKMPEVNWKWNESQVDIIIDEQSLEGQITELTFFIKKLDIKNINESIMKKLVENGIDSIIKIINIELEDLEDIPGFKEKMCEKIYDSIQDGIENMTLLSFMVASNKLGRGLGERKLKKIITEFPNILKIKDNDLYDNIIKLEGYDEISTTLFIKNLPEFKKLFNELPKKLQIKLQKVETKQVYTAFGIKKYNFKDMKIVFSGFRNKDWKQIIEDNEGTVTDSVSKNTSLLVAKEGEQSAKVDKADELGIKILTPEEFAKKYKL